MIFSILVAVGGAFADKMMTVVVSALMAVCVDELPQALNLMKLVS
jgi:hypothetical protein